MPESFCPSCHSDTSESAWIHPELGLRYCSRAHAESHVGVAPLYRVAKPDWFTRTMGLVYRADDCPAEWAGLYVPALDDGGPVSGPIPGIVTVSGSMPAGLPTVCGCCGEAFDVSRDRPSAEYPFCMGCHFSGRVLSMTHHETIAVLRSHGLRGTCWHTGGGCWTLVIQRADAPDRWGSEDDDGVDFVPFVCATDAFEDGGSWHIEAGMPEPGEPFGACYYDSESTWQGDRDSPEPPTIVPATAHALAAFALLHLPA
jgi:hypothetical protein